jgi:RNA polymerase sigma-70 factor (ECF subfamily)
MNSSVRSRKRQRKKIMKYTEEQKTKLIEELWVNSRKKLVNFLYRYNMSPEEREDTVQEAFTRAYKSMDSFRGGCKMETWLFQIAKNIYLNNIRYNHVKKRERTTFDIESYIHTQMFRSSAASITNPIVQAELEKIVDSVIKTKFRERPEWQLVMREIFINDTDMGHAELAEAYGVNARAIRREKFKIGRRIQEKLRAMQII